ncbi:MAG: nuclease A inhibitor family protein [Pyrinomonadaceae bacterium]
MEEIWIKNELKIDKNGSFFHKNNKNSDVLFDEIKLACNGLVYISESDAPLRPYTGPRTTEVTEEIILHQTGAKADAPLEEVAFDEFFGQLTAIKDWFGETQMSKAKRFLALQKLLENNLHSLKVFRIGEIQVDIYAVGIGTDACLMGVMTKAVET